MLNIFYALGTLVDIGSIRIHLTGSVAINSPKPPAYHTRLNCSFHPRFFLQLIFHATGWWSVSTEWVAHFYWIPTISKLCLNALSTLTDLGFTHNTRSRNYFYLLDSETKTSTPQARAHIQTHTCLQEEHVYFEPGSLIPECVLLITPLKCL